MVIFNGKKAAKKILLDLKKRIKKRKIKPKLAVILVGDDSASKLYIKRKKETAKKIGIEVILYKFKKAIKENNIIQKIKDLNSEPSVDGIIVQLPLPKGFNTNKIIKTIDSKKDVDAFQKGKLYFSPVLPSAILIALKSAAKSFKKKKILAIVNSDIFGQTLRDFLRIKGIKINYLLRKKTSLSRLKLADIIITACGVPKLIKGDMIKNKAILIDAGTSFSKGKLIGDVDRKSVEKKAAFLTSVPGGIGPLTVALLLKNVYLAKKLYGFS